VLAADVPAVLIDPLDAVQLPDGLLQRHKRVRFGPARGFGELAADYYLERGFTYFGFCSARFHDINWSREAWVRRLPRVCMPSAIKCEMYGPLTAHERQDWSRRASTPAYLG